MNYGILLRNLGGERGIPVNPLGGPEMARLITDKCINRDMCDPECPTRPSPGEQEIYEIDRIAAPKGRPLP